MKKENSGISRRSFLKGAAATAAGAAAFSAMNMPVLADEEAAASDAYSKRI